MLALKTSMVFIVHPKVRSQWPVVFNFRMLKEGFSSNDLPYYQRHIDSIPLDLAWLYCWLALAGQRELLFA
jgi:hypothetical protein